MNAELDKGAALGARTRKVSLWRCSHCWLADLCCPAAKGSGTAHAMLRSIQLTSTPAASHPTLPCPAWPTW